MRKLTLLLCALIAGISVAMAQTSISGTVLSAENDEPIIGASILVKGTNASTITDTDGKFTVKIPDGAGRTLVISYIGMERQEAFARNGMVVKLNSADQALDDVVVVGYQTIRKEAKTGAIATVEGDELASIPETSVDRMLSGKMAGVSVSTSNGQPGATTNIRIRGTSSVGASNEPLYVVDGIPVESGNSGALTNSINAIALINPSDIASVTVLKDAAAASIYGSRGANGVILITTKSGEAGKSKITARARYGISQLANDNNFEMANLEEYVQYQRTIRLNAGLDVDNPTSEYYFPESLMAKGGTNWMKELTRTGNMQEYELIASGGAGKTTYYTSLSYHKTEGILPKVQFEKMQIRANLDTELNKWLKMGTRIQGGYMKQQDATNGLESNGKISYSNPFFAGMIIGPVYNAYNEDGSFNTTNLDPVQNINPLAVLYETEQADQQYKFNGTLYLELKPIKQLTFRTNNSIEFDYTNGRVVMPGFMLESGQSALQTADMQYRTLTTSNTIAFNDVYNDDHGVDILIGQEGNSITYSYNTGVSQQIVEDRPYHLNAPSEYQSIQDYIDESAMLSFFGVAEYNYAGRYYVKGSIRADASSKFGPDRRWGTFWSVSASWNMHNEAFMQDIKDVLNVLKFRYSYGVNGNEGIGSYAHYGLYADATYNGVTGILPGQLPNRELTWETNKTHNIGVDFRLFDRLNGSVDWYTRRTEDMLVGAPLPYTTGFPNLPQNVGKIRNSGVEIQLDADIFNTNDFKWNAGIVFAANRSKILDLGGEEYLGSVALRQMEGEKFYTYWLYDYAGVNPQNGNALWRNEEGLLTEDADAARRINAGSPEPLWTGGFNTQLSWKGISLAIQLEARYGNKILNQNRMLVEHDGADYQFNVWKGALNYWKEPGDTDVLPKPVYNNPSDSDQNSTRYLEDGSYLRIKDITLAYNLPSRWTQKALMSGVRIYASAVNLYTFHNVNFYDPEFGVGGVSTVSYPMTRSMIVGVDITF